MTDEAFGRPLPLRGHHQRGRRQLGSHMVTHRPADGLAAALFIAPAAAQDATQKEQTSQAAVGVSDQKIEAFAVAYLEVQKVRQDYSARIEAEPDESAQRKLTAEANQRIIQTVESSPNISVDEYNTILTSADQDPELLQKVNEKLRSVQSTQP